NILSHSIDSLLHEGRIVKMVVDNRVVISFNFADGCFCQFAFASEFVCFSLISETTPHSLGNMIDALQFGHWPVHSGVSPGETFAITIAEVMDHFNASFFVDFLM